MKVGDEVQVKAGPHGGMMATVIEIRDSKIVRRGTDRKTLLMMPVIRCMTPLNRTFTTGMDNLMIREA